MKNEGKIIIIKNKKAYDLTLYLNSHPGGKDAIINNQSKDNTESFNFHSKQAQKKWKKFLIGKIIK